MSLLVFSRSSRFLLHIEGDIYVISLVTDTLNKGEFEATEHVAKITNEAGAKTKNDKLLI